MTPSTACQWLVRAGGRSSKCGEGWVGQVGRVGQVGLGGRVGRVELAGHAGEVEGAVWRATFRLEREPGISPLTRPHPPHSAR
jgi:hypothetical protein